MIDLAIVGAGLTGLALAQRLQAQGVTLNVFDARPRAGGRMLTHLPAGGGAAVDLGASWYWPETEPRITALVESLGLKTFEQPDQGQVLHLSDAGTGPQPMDVQSIHGGARRLSGGVSQLVAALEAQLKADTVQLNHRLVTLRDAGDHIELSLARTEDGIEHMLRVQARRVVLALPPRLVNQAVRFQPALSEATVAALNAVPTWMAREGKGVARYDKPFWLTEGKSGSAFASHHQAVLREVWDASDERGAALAGFFFMDPATREQFARSLPLLVSSQFAQLFGPDAHTEAIVMQDWAKEAWTCSEMDLSDQEGGIPQADPLLRRPHWSGRLFFGGTETARQAAGHMEGALESAARLADFLKPVRASQTQPAQHLGEALQTFNTWVDVERAGAMGRYKQHLNHMLSRQDQDRVTQRAMLATVEQTYTRALEQLAQLDVCSTDLAPSGRSELTPQVLAAFSGFSKALADEALRFNATSCALSNFQDEHKPGPDYLRAITADLAAAWREFAWATNDLLCARSMAVN
jgi:monoamine oxidase